MLFVKTSKQVKQIKDRNKGRKREWIGRSGDLLNTEVLENSL